jgi:hypothetical protein
MKTLDKAMTGRKSKNACGNDKSPSARLNGWIQATGGSWNETLDRCLVLLMFRHGLHFVARTRLPLAHTSSETRVLRCS